MTDFETITVPAHLCGYPGVAFGGYVAGVLAARAAAETVRVDFRRPVPTDAPVRLAPTADGGVRLVDGELLLAAATPADPAVEAPEPPSWEQARAAADAYRAAPPDGMVDCFGCGLHRTPATGLRLHCGPVPGSALVAAAWTPGPGLGGADGLLPPELVWGALDCPGNAAGRLLDDRRAGAVTAALTARLLRPVPVGAGLVSYAWLLGSEGRKYRVGTALATAGGDLCAVGEALWVEPRTQAQPQP
ncbi:hotdog fold domain-containing protein [Streptomyces sp. NBC_01443]|uniref:hotdog fold domain-containing protein n=1 Tax=Streptomyces sp. NBC_01443 TaxID=2903868 RepID=UPI002259A701|nr:hotdog fold domain-containing protein [Streptomyces sp. NBC_01443]MCX4630036.1 hotdog fold thioesterase [Streptomyces sp. NBC_01443]WSW45995.1 hotdog fold thioesterase [Streptomyces sp. NBC_01001]